MWEQIECVNILNFTYCFYQRAEQTICDIVTNLREELNVQVLISVDHCWRSDNRLMDRARERSGNWSVERADNQVSGSAAWSGVIEIDMSGERIFRHSRYAHLLR